MLTDQEIDKENTVRILSNKAVIAKNQWWCAIGIHMWTRWSPTQRLVKYSYTYFGQTRECIHCGRVKHRPIDNI